MEFKYRGWVIDPTPDFSLGRFFAHARLIHGSPDDDAVDAEMHIEHIPAWFDNEDEAIQVARQWAIEWIDTREGSTANSDTDSSIQAKTSVR